MWQGILKFQIQDVRIEAKWYDAMTNIRYADTLISIKDSKCKDGKNFKIRNRYLREARVTL